MLQQVVVGPPLIFLFIGLEWGSLWRRLQYLGDTVINEP
jgi:hypothetical protein